MRLKELKEIVDIPEGIQVSIDKNIIKIKGSKGELEKSFISYRIKVSKEENKIIISAKNVTKNIKRNLETFTSLIKNMIRGVKEGYIYKLKICASHFPITVTVEGDTFIIKNYLGERVPRKIKIKPNIEVKVEKDTILVSGTDKELVGQVCSDIENLSKICDKDRRRFQDGIYLTEKAKRELK